MLKIEYLKNKEVNRLVLVLKQVWFDMWESGIKKEDYRDLTSRWLSILFGVKLVDQDGKKANDNELYDWMLANKDQFLANHKPRQYDYIELNFAYETNRPQCKSNFMGIDIREGHKEWGAKEGRIYFCIMGQDIYDRKNIIK